MENLDLRDRKILYHLDLNSRQSFSQLGTKVGIHKDVVAYRVNKLLEKGIIKNITSINEHKLGFCYLRVCLTFQYVTPQIKHEIIDYFVQNKYTVIVHESEGHYDLKILLAVKNVPIFYPIWYKIFCKYRDYFSNVVISINCETIEYKYSFLLDEKERNENTRVRLRRYDNGTIPAIDELDYKILKLLSYNARIPTLEIAEKLMTTVVTVNNRIKKMNKFGIILGFRVVIDYSKIGYHFYTVDIFLKDTTKIQQIIEYAESNPNLVRRVISLGSVDLEFMFILKNLDNLHGIMNDISSKFPAVIKNMTYTNYLQTYKYQYLPDV